MAKPKIEFPLFSKLILWPGLVIVLCPRLVFVIAGHLSPAVPRHVELLTRMLMSTLGLLVCVIELVPVLMRANRAE